jgi:hypothetical protein
MIQMLTACLSWLRHLLGIDRAVGFTVLARSWSIFAGMINILLIARFLSPTEQGYYYTFASLVALQTVFELGFSFVILQLAAHETAQLQIESTGIISGSEVAHSRLASVLQKAILWYTIAAVLLGIALTTAGFTFFSKHRQPLDTTAWVGPWICIVIAVMFTFQMDPIFSFLEGCGFVAQVARMRLSQAVIGSILAWLAFTHYMGLFAPAGIVAGQAIAGMWFLFSKRHFLLPLIRRKTGKHNIPWRTEMWPFQWRLAASFLFSYLIIPLFNPFLFASRGAVEAGKMGMSTSIAGALGTVALAWMSTKAAPFGNLIARGDYKSLDRIFFRTLLQSSVLLLVGIGAVIGTLFFVALRFQKFASRILTIPTLTLLFFTIFLTHIFFSETLYLRSHKREPFLPLNMTIAAVMCISTFVTSRLWGATGVVIGFFLCGGVLNLIGGTYIFLKYRKEWHCSHNSVLSSVSEPKELTSKAL